MCQHNEDCKCLEILHKRAIRYSEDEQAAQNPQTGGTMRAEGHPRFTVTEEEWERMVPFTVERVTQANQNPRSRLSAVPGRSGNSEVFRGSKRRLTILKVPYVLPGESRVPPKELTPSAEEFAYQEKWEEDMALAQEEMELTPQEAPVTANALKLEEFREGVDLNCPECGTVRPGEICNCPVGNKTWNGATPK